ncbi:MAG: hypothetical protein ChlgKO_14420 [Chlamydiales bacterium]
MTVTATYTPQTLPPEEIYNFLLKDKAEQSTSKTSLTPDKQPKNKTIERTTLSADMVRAFLEAFPERQEIEDLVSSRCQKIHIDKKLNCLSTHFKEIITLNEELFSSKSTDEKANILYQYHSDNIARPIILNDFPRLLKSFFQKILPLDRTLETRKIASNEFTKIIYLHLNQLHSGYPRLAIAKALDLPSRDVASLPNRNILVERQLQKPLMTPLYDQ